ncbi:MAG: hypothetical protein VKK80_03060, partial [Prochlorothrix sp.]|nr:hypothetical protein [Prochlorothrix sp.]
METIAWGWGDIWYAIILPFIILTCFWLGTSVYFYNPDLDFSFNFIFIIIFIFLLFWDYCGFTIIINQKNHIPLYVEKVNKINLE